MIVMSTFREKCQLSMNSPKKLLHWSSWSHSPWQQRFMGKVCSLLTGRGPLEAAPLVHSPYPQGPQAHAYPPYPPYPISPMYPGPGVPGPGPGFTVEHSMPSVVRPPPSHWGPRPAAPAGFAAPGGLRAAGLPAGPPASRIMLKQADGFPEVRVYATPLASTGHVAGRCWIFWSPCSSCSMPPGMIIISHPSWQGNHRCFVSLQYAWTYCRKPDFGESSVVTHASHTHLIFVGLNTPGRYHSKWNFGGLAWSAGQLATGVLRQFAWLGGGQARWPPTFARPWPPWGSPWRGWASGVELGQ